MGLRAEDKERGLWARWEDEEDELEEREEWPRMRAEERQKSSFFIHRVQGQASFYGYVEGEVYRSSHQRSLGKERFTVFRAQTIISPSSIEASQWCISYRHLSRECGIQWR